MEGPVALLSAVQSVYPCPLFNESNILDAAGHELADSAIANKFYQADNLEVLRILSQTENNPPVKLIYIDPPFMSQIHYHSLKENSSQHAFEDRWQPERYLDMLYPRLRLMKEVLAEDGSIFVHVDWHVSHYVHLLLDEIFGGENFINEIVWCYSGGGNSRRHLQRKHDLIFWYGKSSSYTYHPQHRPYTKGTLERGLTAVKGDKYKLAAEGALLQDWWTDINKILSPTAYENHKYPTQKPRQLLQRIINMASNPGDLVADFFAGSGTTAEVCNELGRPWILCDNSPLSLQTTISRLARNDSLPFTIYASYATDKKVAGQETAASTANLKMKEVTIQENGDDYIWLSLGIDYYQPEVLSENWDPEEFASAIEFWEIDPDYDETRFNSRYQLFRPPHQKTSLLPLNILLSLPRCENYKIAVKVHDSFAGQQIQVLHFSLSDFANK
ncbi:MAG TPA: site-specific DNA-methyltransferase [Syntrophomonas sp.]|nr:site-specific DNA-methyltransferase [Syntrophomonas sp.]